jgi:hypothetical protein
MITLELLEEFCSSEFHKSEFITYFKLFGDKSILIMFDEFIITISVDRYYEWFNGRRDSKLESIGI